jgi:hypothetical protein
MPVHDDPFAEWFPRVLRGEITIGWPDGILSVDRSGQFGQRLSD